jgi:carbonic anhydrase
MSAYVCFTVQVGVMGDVFVEGGSLDGKYQTLQFHFHWGSVDGQGSEHTFEGHAYPMEVLIITILL